MAQQFSGTALAGPTKRFFVSMLTRDIELKDAILDLLDNCVDGIQRQLGHVNGAERPYEGFFANLIATPESFVIEDNCGGIPRAIAEESAFMLGRALDDDSPADLHTVGMYGIGMKRAIFKMGKNCVVYSNPKGEEFAFEVKISPEWLTDNTKWDLPITFGVDKIPQIGTRIVITELAESVAMGFDPERSQFLTELATSITEFYALIMGKGLTVNLNGVALSPAPLTLMHTGKDEGGIEPYVFAASIDDVQVEVSVGFRRALATQRELDSEAEEPRTSDEAGWTVICNDRVVLYNDKGPITGWGRGNVPKYHNQFIAIAGVVQFRSPKLYNLPLTTTKRGLDTGNTAYLGALDYMMEGLKIFTDFTNKWKGRETETTAAFEAAKPIAFGIAAQATLKSSRAASVRKLGPNSRAIRVFPKLPYPEETNAKRRITYTRATAEIELLTAHFFPGSEDIEPSDVGIATFEDCLKRVGPVASK